MRGDRPPPHNFSLPLILDHGALWEEQLSHSNSCHNGHMHLIWTARVYRPALRLGSLTTAHVYPSNLEACFHFNKALKTTVLEFLLLSDITYGNSFYFLKLHIFLLHLVFFFLIYSWYTFALFIPNPFILPRFYLWPIYLVGIRVVMKFKTG